MDFTGERFVPGADGGILEAEHIQRYLFASKYAKGKTILDIACGSGYGSSILCKAGATAVTGVDISVEAIDYASKHYGNETTKFITCDAEHFNNGKYDMIVSFETLEHLDNRQLLLENMYSMLNNQGLLIISTPNKVITSPMKSTSRIRNKYHKYEYQENELISILQKVGFKTIQKFGQHFYPGIYKIQLISRLLRRRFNYDSLETAQVAPMVNEKVPRYFVFIAS